MTYSIVAIDEGSGAHGVAVASKAMCVGAHVPWGRGGVGAVATQAFHDLRYGWEGLALLEQSHSAASTVFELTNGDSEAPYRQLGVVDRNGRAGSYTGSACMPWAGGMTGAGYAVQGNILASAAVVEAMAAAYEDSFRLPFAGRLAHALLAGDAAGGDRRGRQSAALKIWRVEVPGPDMIDVAVDLRIDDAAMPVHALCKLVPTHELEYGPPDLARVVPLTGAALDKVGGLLRSKGLPCSAPSEVEAALELWARQENLESRLVPRAVDETVLQVLEHGKAALLMGVPGRDGRGATR